MEAQKKWIVYYNINGRNITIKENLTQSEAVDLANRLDARYSQK